MTQKAVPLIIILLVIVVSATILFYTAPVEETFSENPKDWIKENERVISVDIREATQAKGSFEYERQKLQTKEGLVGLFFNLVFEGKLLEKSNYSMKISPDLNPTDGAINFFALVKEESGKLVLYLFVDEDWKQKSNGELNLIYGDIQDKDALIQRKFNFLNSKNGVYIDKLDCEWLKEPEYYRLFVGEITKEQIKNSQYNLSTYVVIT